jgi:hypothetical protein
MVVRCNGLRLMNRQREYIMLHGISDKLSLVLLPGKWHEHR